jgi:phosphoenolpyruvate carboxykinase (ATP)
MKLAYTRAMVNAALNGELTDGGFVQDPVFGVMVPTACPDVPAEILQPRNTWGDKAAFDAQARKLASMFVANFQQYADQASEAIRAAAPHPNA